METKQTHETNWNLFWDLGVITGISHAQGSPLESGYTAQVLYRMCSKKVAKKHILNLIREQQTRRTLISTQFLLVNLSLHKSERWDAIPDGKGGCVLSLVQKDCPIAGRRKI